MDPNQGTWQVDDSHLAWFHYCSHADIRDDVRLTRTGGYPQVVHLPSNPRPGRARIRSEH